MGKLAGLLSAAGGEKASGSAFWRWCQEIAAKVDALLEAPYIEVRRATSDQSVDFSASEDIVLNTIAVDGGIAYDIATGVFTLAEAGLYELEFFGAWTNFGTPNTTAATAQWVSHQGLPFPTGLSTWVVSATGTQNTGSQPVAKVLYLAPAGAQVKVQASSLGGGGTADLLRGASYATVRKLN